MHKQGHTSWSTRCAAKKQLWGWNPRNTWSLSSPSQCFELVRGSWKDLRPILLPPSGLVGHRVVALLTLLQARASQSHKNRLLAPHVAVEYQEDGKQRDKE